jgi:hypothetical protein
MGGSAAILQVDGGGGGASGAGGAAMRGINQRVMGKFKIVSVQLDSDGESAAKRQQDREMQNKPRNICNQDS